MAGLFSGWWRHVSLRDVVGHRARERARVAPLPAGHGLRPRARGLSALRLPDRPRHLHHRRWPDFASACVSSASATARPAIRRIDTLALIVGAGKHRHPTARGDREPRAPRDGGARIRGRRPEQAGDSRSRAPQVLGHDRRPPPAARRPRGARGAGRHPVGPRRGHAPHRAALCARRGCGIAWCRPSASWSRAA